MSESTALTPGTRLGTYRIVGLLGEGGFGAVYEAVHQTIGRKVAIKVLHAEFARNKEFTGRFFNEARAVNIVDHPGLVQISDYGQLPDGTAFLVMELLRGESLAKRLSEAPGKMPIGDVLALGWQIADTLSAAHEKGIVHRDLKPDNVMLVSDRHIPSGERCKILDFGLAKLTEASASAMVKTKSNAVMGTPLYMSPEQCAGAGGVDAKTDVYALGCMLYEMLTGQPPFIAEGAGQVLGMHMFKEPLPLRQRTPGVPPPLAAFVHRLLDKEKDHRPGMQQAATELESLAKLAPPPVRRLPRKDEPSHPDSPVNLGLASTLGQAPAQTVAPWRSRQAVVVAGSLSILGLFAGGLVVTYRGTHPAMGPRHPVQAAPLPLDMASPSAAVPVAPPPVPTEVAKPTPKTAERPGSPKLSRADGSSPRRSSKAAGKAIPKAPATETQPARAIHERPKVED